MQYQHQLTPGVDNFEKVVAKPRMPLYDRRMTTDYTIQTVDTLDLLRALEGSVDAPDGDFVTMIEHKLEDNLRWNHRVAALWDGEEQVKPIVVCVNGNNDYGRGRRWVLGNGNHRFAAAIAGMLPEVLVLFTEDEDEYMYEDVTD